MRIFGSSILLQIFCVFFLAISSSIKGADSNDFTAYSDLNSVWSDAKKKKQPILLYLVSESNALSKKFDSEIMQNEKMKTKLGGYLLARINVSSDHGKEVFKKHGWNDAPFLAILNQEGDEFGVLDFSSVNEQLINQELVQQVSSWLEKEGKRFTREPGLGYVQREISKEDPIRAIIEKWKGKKEIYEKENLALLLDEAKIKVDASGSSDGKYHIITYLGEDGATGGRTWREVFSRQTKYKLIRARTITADFKENLLDPSELEETPIYRNYPELDQYRSVSFGYPGAKKGCYTEVEYEIAQAAQMPNHFSFQWMIETNHLLSLDSRLEVEIPTSLDLQYRIVGNTALPQIENKEGVMHFVWKGESQHFQHRSKFDAHSSISGSVILASKTSWEEIGKWFLQLCDKSRERSPEMDAWASQAVTQLTPGDKYEKRVVNALMARLAREFRYLAFNIHESGYVPHTPKQTFENKYGDCKDFSLFLQECLKKAGISSDLVLLQPDSLLEMKEQLPRVPYFTHCILRVQTEKGPFYVDPTAFDFAAGIIPYSSCSTTALVCGSGGVQVVQMPSVDSEGGFQIAVEFSGLQKPSVKTTLDIKFLGASKESMRKYYGGFSDEALKHVPKRLFEKVFDHYNPSKCESSGEQVNADVFSMNFFGNAEKPFIAGERLIEVPLFLSYPQFGMGLPQYCSSEHEEKNFGLYTGHRRAPISQRITYQIPPGYEIQDSPKEIKVKTDYFDVTRSVEVTPTQVTISTAVIIKFVPGESRFVPSNKLPEEARKIKDQILSTMVFLKGDSQNIFEACSKGDLVRAKELIAGGANLEVLDLKGQTPMHVAARAGKNELVKLLVEKGGKINALNQSGETPLFLACNWNKLDVALTLIAAGADLEVKTKRGYTPLMGASNYWEMIEVVKQLLAKKVDVNAVSDEGSALFYAVTNNNLEAIDLLFKAGADPYLNSGEKGFGETFIYPLLGVAASKGKLETMKKLIACGIDLNRPAREGTTPLMLAVGFKQPEAVKLLLDAGAKIDIQAQDGGTALFRAVRYQQPEMVKLLLARNADVNFQDLAGKTPLMVAAAHKNKEIAQILIEAKADLNRKAARGESVLAIASDLGDKAMIDLLKKNGAIQEEPRIIPREKRKNPLAPDRAWALTMAAVYYQVHGLDAQYLGGAQSLDAKGFKSNLKGSWDIKNKADLLNSLENLRDKGHHISYQLQGKKLAEMNDENFEKFLTGPTVNPSNVEGMRLLRQNYLRWNDRTGLAWDWVRYIIMAGMGHGAGFITEDEAFQLILPVATQLQKTFSSWEEMGANYVDGRKIWAGKADPNFDTCYQLLINKKDPNSPWNVIPWNQNPPK